MHKTHIFECDIIDAIEYAKNSLRGPWRLVLF